MGAAGDEEPSVRLNPHHPKLFNFGVERLWVYHDTVTDDALALLVEDPGRYEVKHKLSVTDPHGVAGIVAALIARDDIEVGRKNIYNFTLSLVTPLRADYYDVFHCRPGIISGAQ
jgi:hypothetical protein